MAFEEALSLRLGFPTHISTHMAGLLRLERMSVSVYMEAVHRK